MTTPVASIVRTDRPPIPGPAVLVAGAAIGLLAGWVADTGTSAIAAGGVLGALAVAAGVPDLRVRRIPNLAVLAGAVVLGAIVAAVEIGGSRPAGGSVAAGAVLAGGLLLAIHLARPAGLGFGDVKLATVLGGGLGVVHWSAAAAMLGLAACVGATGAMILPAWRRSIPFGTCMAASAVATLAAASWLRDAAHLW